MPRLEDSPEAAVWRMIDAARASDSERYLDCTTGEMEQSLRRNFQEMGPARSREYLASLHAPVKSVALFPAQAVSPAETCVSVEYVYEGRNETQQFYLRRVGKWWRIFRVENAEPTKVGVPYGTPVSD